MFYTEETVRFADTDMMGIAHHANYFRWFESARVAWLKKAGISLWEMMGDGFSFPIKKVTCDYKKSAFYDDTLRIYVKMLEVNRAKMTFAYEVRRNQDVIALARTTNVFTDSKNKITRLPEKYYEPMLAFCATEKGGDA